MCVGMVFAPVVYASTSWLDRADYRLPQEAERSAGGVGAALMALALWLSWRSHVNLGRNYSPSLQLRESHALVTQGVYRHVPLLWYGRYAAMNFSCSSIISVRYEGAFDFLARQILAVVVIGRTAVLQRSLADTLVRNPVNLPAEGFGLRVVWRVWRSPRKEAADAQRSLVSFPRSLAKACHR